MCQEKLLIDHCLVKILVFVSRLAMIEQERRDRELALRLAQDPDAVDTEAAQQVTQLPLQRYADNFISINKSF